MTTSSSGAVPRKLLVLDLDETLIHSSLVPLGRVADFRVGPFHVYVRPGAEELIGFCRTKFQVAVWTSSTADYAGAVVTELFGSDHRLEFLWARDRCTEVLTPEMQTYRWVKDLTKVQRLGYVLSQVLAVDDSASAHALNYDNLIHVLPYLGSSEDGELHLLMRYLPALAALPNVREVDKRGWRGRLDRKND